MMSSDYGMIHTADLNMKDVIKMAENVASSRASVLITGESGTGKELLARYIHEKSARSHKEFVAINCAAVPENLIESELFGFEKGSFTGADKVQIGKFELANDGTFLLDEISELPLNLQAKLLRVIQENEVERIGGRRPIKINVRLIATTNRDLGEMVQKGLFREDLYYRLNVIPLKIPPLRLRPRDIKVLADLFTEVSCVVNEVPVKRLDGNAYQKLMSWNWPGNVRELENVIERSVLLSPHPLLGTEDIQIEGYQPCRTGALQPGMTISDAERELILQTLEHTRNNKTRAADLLGISIRTLRNKLHEYRAVGVI